MGAAYGMVVCLAYILGLLSTGVWWGGAIVLLVGIGCALIVPRFWRAAPRSRIWLVAGGIGFLASVYFQFRVPQPAANDISRVIAADGKPDTEIVVKLAGKVESLPRLTRSEKSQFWLAVQQVTTVQGSQSALDLTQPVGGRLYVTAPPQFTKKLHPGQFVWLTGSLYHPATATNPGTFDFQKYLQQEDCFAGLRAQAIEIPPQPTHWGWWMVQQRIVRSQQRWLTPAEGALVSSMVLGSRGVDLPADLKDQFVRVGLAHALAASGFQTSLILGVVLVLTRRCSERVQFLVGTLALVIFVGLTGIQPAVLRAAVMGFGGLVALLLRRQIKPLGTLLVTATLLLLYNPNWIWNLGFQLSFLATIGLLVTVPPLTKWLDWLPTAIAPLLAVPIAAYLWTLPLQLYAFGVLSPYSIPVNLVTTPFISLLSLGGMASALVAVVWSPAGSALAWLLKYPTQGLIAIVNGCAQLPGNAFAVGTISVVTAIALYGFMGLTWLQPWWRRRWWLALLLGIGLVAIPTWQAQATLLRVTVLATATQPVMVIQDRGQTTLMNSGDEKTVGFTVLPFLQKQGINEIRWAVATDRQLLSRGWALIRTKLPIRSAYAIGATNAAIAGQSVLPTLQSLPLNRAIPLGTTTIKLLRKDPPLLTLQMSGQSWLWMGETSPEQQFALIRQGTLPAVNGLWWSGQWLHPELLARLRPQVAIASGKTIHPQTEDQFRKMGVRPYLTGRDGAIQWTSQAGIKTMLESSDNQSSSL